MEETQNKTDFQRPLERQEMTRNYSTSGAKLLLQKMRGCGYSITIRNGKVVYYSPESGGIDNNDLGRSLESTIVQFMKSRKANKASTTGSAVPVPAPQTLSSEPDDESNPPQSEVPPPMNGDHLASSGQLTLEQAAEKITKPSNVSESLQREASVSSEGEFVGVSSLGEMDKPANSDKNLLEPNNHPIDETSKGNPNIEVTPNLDITIPEGGPTSSHAASSAVAVNIFKNRVEVGLRDGQNLGPVTPLAGESEVILVVETLSDSGESDNNESGMTLPVSDREINMAESLPNAGSNPHEVSKAPEEVPCSMNSIPTEATTCNLTSSNNTAVTNSPTTPSAADGLPVDTNNSITQTVLSTPVVVEITSASSTPVAANGNAKDCQRSNSSRKRSLATEGEDEAVQLSKKARERTRDPSSSISLQVTSQANDFCQANTIQQTTNTDVSSEATETLLSSDSDPNNHLHEGAQTQTGCDYPVLSIPELVDKPVSQSENHSLEQNELAATETDTVIPDAILEDNLNQFLGSIIANLACALLTESKKVAGPEIVTEAPKDTDLMTGLLEEMDTSSDSRDCDRPLLRIRTDIFATEEESEDDGVFGVPSSTMNAGEYLLPNAAAVAGGTTSSQDMAQTTQDNLPWATVSLGNLLRDTSCVSRSGTPITCSTAVASTVPISTSFQMTSGVPVPSNDPDVLIASDLSLPVSTGNALTSCNQFVSNAPVAGTAPVVSTFAIPISVPVTFTLPVSSTTTVPAIEDIPCTAVTSSIPATTTAISIPSSTTSPHVPINSEHPSTNEDSTMINTRRRLINTANDYSARLANEFAVLKRVCEANNSSNINELVQAINNLQRSAYNLFDQLDVSLHVVKIQNPGLEVEASSCVPPDTLNDLELTIEELADYFEILLDGLIFSRSCKNEKMAGAIMVSNLRLIRLLSYFMCAKDPEHAEQKFTNVLFMITGRPSLTHLETGVRSKVIVRVWDSIRANGAGELQKQGAIMDHVKYGARNFKSRLEKVKASYTRALASNSQNSQSQRAPSEPAQVSVPNDSQYRTMATFNATQQQMTTPLQSTQLNQYTAPRTQTSEQLQFHARVQSGQQQNIAANYQQRYVQQVTPAQVQVSNQQMGMQRTSVVPQQAPLHMYTQSYQQHRARAPVQAQIQRQQNHQIAAQFLNQNQAQRRVPLPGQQQVQNRTPSTHSPQLPQGNVQQYQGLIVNRPPTQYQQMQYTIPHPQQTQDQARQLFNQQLQRQQQQQQQRVFMGRTVPVADTLCSTTPVVVAPSNFQIQAANSPQGNTEDDVIYIGASSPSLLSQPRVIPSQPVTTQVGQLNNPPENNNIVIHYGGVQIGKTPYSPESSSNSSLVRTSQLESRLSTDRNSPGNRTASGSPVSGNPRTSQGSIMMNATTSVPNSANASSTQQTRHHAISNPVAWSQTSTASNNIRPSVSQPNLRQLLEQDGTSSNSVVEPGVSFATPSAMTFGQATNIHSMPNINSGRPGTVQNTTSVSVGQTSPAMDFVDFQLAQERANTVYFPNANGEVVAPANFNDLIITPFSNTNAS